MRYVKILFSILITIIILYFLFTIVDFKGISNSFSKIPLKAIIFSFVFYIFSYILKTFRFWELNERKIKFNKMFSVVCIHSFFSIILPAKIGELSYVYLVRNEENNSTEKGIATLILARLMDLGMVFLSLFLGLILFKNQLGLNPKIYWVIVGSLVLILFLTIVLIYGQHKILNLIRKIIDFTKIKRIFFFLSILDKLKKSRDYFRIISTRKTITLSLFYSLGIIFTHYLFFYSLLKGMGLEISFIQVIIGSIILLVVAAIPIQGIGGFGTYEGAWSIALIVLGFNSDVSIASSFVIHLFQLFYLIILGFVGMIYYKLSRYKDQLIPKKPEEFIYHAKK